MKEKILELLKTAEGYISGQDICNQLGVSRTAVWKNMNALKNEGYIIDSVTNKGYCLCAEPDIITEARIKEYLQTRWLGQDIVYKNVMDSTNVKAKYLGEDGAANGTVVVTECQTAGKGRRGRGWISPQGVNIYYTLLLRPEVEVSRASMLTLVAALSVSQAVNEVAKIDTQIKWPNDIVLNGKKICGILTESSTDLEYINYLVIGIGVNVNQTEFCADISEVATSIFLETGCRIDRARLLGECLNQFEKYYEIFLQSEDMSGLMSEYNERLVNCQREVKIIEKGQEKLRKAIGINEMGELVTEDGEGRREYIISGEVSVRGLYGYV